MKILLVSAILSSVLSGTMYGQTLQVDSLFISEKDSVVLVYGALPIAPATLTVSGYALALKNWSSTVGEFYLPVSGGGASGEVRIASATDTVAGWTIEEWSLPIKHSFSYYPSGTPQAYPNAMRSDLVLFCRFAVHRTSERCTERLFPVSPKSSWRWNCDGSITFDMYYTWKYSGDGAYQWKDIYEPSAKGFAVACAYNVHSDSITFSFPEPQGARYHSELWYYTRYNTKVSESDGDLTFTIPKITFALHDTAGSPGKIADAYRTTSWDTVRQTRPQVLAVRPAQGGSSARVYPHPFTEFVNIEFALATSDPQRIHVMDVLGRHITTVYSCAYDGRHHAQVRSYGLDPGTYYFVVEGSDITGSLIVCQRF